LVAFTVTLIKKDVLSDIHESDGNLRTDYLAICLLFNNFLVVFLHVMVIPSPIFLRDWINKKFIWIQ